MPQYFADILVLSTEINLGRGGFAEYARVGGLGKIYDWALVLSFAGE